MGALQILLCGVFPEGPSPLVKLFCVGRYHPYFVQSPYYDDHPKISMKKSKNGVFASKGVKNELKMDQKSAKLLLSEF